MKKYPFKDLSELHDKIVEAGFDPNDHEIVVNISRTPLESMYPEEVSYGNPARKYTSLGFGSDVDTPWGPLPEIVLLLRSDVLEKIIESSPIESSPKVEPKKKVDLFPPGWKPRPGFTDPRV